MANVSAVSATGPGEGNTMDGMTPAHAKPARRDNLLWAVAVITAFALYDIWGAWAQVGNKSGFAHGTGWTLTVIVEVYGVCALCAWLAPAGPRSRRFAMWSAAAMFALSLVGQASSHLTARTEIPPPAVVVFVSVLPVITLALIAVLVHLRHLDRADAAQAEEAARKAGRRAAAEAQEADERIALRAELEAERAALQPLRDALETAQRELGEALTRAEALTQKLAAVSAQKKRVKAAGSSRARSGENDPTNELRAVMELRANPKLMQPRMSGELARALGLSAATGRRLHGKLVADGALTQYAQSLIGPLSERSPDHHHERSDERS